MIRSSLFLLEELTHDLFCFVSLKWLRFLTSYLTYQKNVWYHLLSSLKSVKICLFQDYLSVAGYSAKIALELFFTMPFYSSWSYDYSRSTHYPTNAPWFMLLLVVLHSRLVWRMEVWHGEQHWWTLITMDLWILSRQVVRLYNCKCNVSVLWFQVSSIFTSTLFNKIVFWIA